GPIAVVYDRPRFLSGPNQDIQCRASRCAPHRPRETKFAGETNTGIESRQGLPRAVLRGCLDSAFDVLTRQPECQRSAAQRTEKCFRCRPFTPGGSLNGHRMHEQLAKKRAVMKPETASCRIHHLNEGPVLPPDDHEMCMACSGACDRYGRQRAGFAQQNMIE